MAISGDPLEQGAPIAALPRAGPRRDSRAQWQRILRARFGTPCAPGTHSPTLNHRIFAIAAPRLTRDARGQ